MIPHLLFVLVLSILTQRVTSEQWYMPDSNLINEQQFNELVIQDKTVYKFVKYFTPHCIYCRYLKNVIDVLKHQKQWCFKIYDFNCQWYPQHCMTNVRAPSFPYTAIHNELGEMFQEVVGFYPEPIIRAIFERIQLKCLEVKQLKSQNETPISLSLAKEQKQQENGIQSKNQQQLQSQPQNLIVPQVQIIPESTQNIPKKQQPTHFQPHQNNHIQIKVSNSEAKIHTGQDHELTIYSYIFYGLSILAAISYFNHIIKAKGGQCKEERKHQPQERQPLLKVDPKHKERNIIQETIQTQQAEMLAAIPDQQL